MKSLFMFISLVFLCCIVCQQGKQVAAADVEEDIQAIKEGFAEWEAGVDAANIDKSLTSFADDVILVPPNEPAYFGKEAFQSYFQRIFDRFIVNEKYVVKDVRVSGDLAFAHITYSGTYTPKAGGDPNTSKGNVINIVEKQPDGVWKIIYSTWSDESLVYPDQAE
jgi:uncharacterized protein (TIGR02246 family)